MKYALIARKAVCDTPENHLYKGVTIMKKLRKIMKVICAMTAFAVMLSLFTACDQHDDKVDPTSRETETQITPDFSEPNQSIASSVATTETETSSSETATPTQSGAYTYEAYGYSFAMDINIDDYIYVNDVTGNTCFKFYSLAEDLGWRPHRANGDTSYTLDSDQPVEWYEYDFGNDQVMIIYIGTDGSSNNPISRGQVSMIGYSFVNYPIPAGLGSGEKCYDSDKQNNPQYCESIFMIPNHSSESEWLSLGGGPRVTGALSREDAIILAYLLSVGPQHPGENPIYYSDFINSGYDSYSLGQYNLPY